MISLKSKAKLQNSKHCTFFMKVSNTPLLFFISFFILTFATIYLSVHLHSVMKEKKTLEHDIKDFNQIVNTEENTFNTLQSDLVSLLHTKTQNEKILNEKYSKNNDKLVYLSKLKNQKSLMTNKQLQNRLSEILTVDEISQIEKWTNKTVLFPCFASEGSLAFSGKQFHHGCDIYPHTVSVIKTKQGEIVGGYTSQTWEGEKEKYDDTAFLFNINDKRKFNIKKGKVAIKPSYENLPVFGDDLSLTKDVYFSNFPSSYSNEDEEGKEHRLFNDKRTLLQPIAIEVFVLN